MKKLLLQKKSYLLGVVLVMLASLPAVYAQELQNYTVYTGKVMDNTTNEPLESVQVSIKNTNINTITNTEGNYSIKVPKGDLTNVAVFSNLGYTTKQVSLTALADAKTIGLEPKVTQLSEVNVLFSKNPKELVKKVFEKKADNNMNEPVVMTAFYRETIKRRNRNVSLTEAVVNLYKQPYTSTKSDVIELHKARKSTDYRRLDTVAFKLQGGPFSALYLDVMKYPEYIFTDASINDYTYTYKSPTTINGKTVFVIDFDQPENTSQPHFAGTLYIDANSLALASASYRLYVGDNREASEIFVKKKPSDINVYPVEATYQVDYREKDGKWNYGYGSAQLTFKVDQKGKLFNTTYSLSTEMAVTDWIVNTDDSKVKYKNRMRQSVIMTDEVLGFADPDFWGAYNVIEPEKSIESAIQKIQRNLERNRG